MTIKINIGDEIIEAKKVKIFATGSVPDKNDSEFEIESLYFFEECGLDTFEDSGFGGPYTYRIEIEL